MRQFNLEEAKAGKKVVTRDGREVIGLHKFDGVNDDFDPLYGVVGGMINCWKGDGRYHEKWGSSIDLFMASEKKKVWVSLYHPFGYKNKLATEISYSEPQRYSTTIKIFSAEIEV